MNVDLEIVSRSKLDAIEKVVQDKAHALFCGPVRRGIFLLSLECNRYPKDAESVPALFLAVDGVICHVDMLMTKRPNPTLQGSTGFRPGSDPGTRHH
jgi:hypothetical protein